MPNGKIRVSELLGTAAAIGFTPQQVYEMSMYEFNVAVRGFIRANTPVEKGKFASEDERDDIFDWLMRQELPNKKTLKNKIYLWDGINFIFQKEVVFEVME